MKRVLYISIFDHADTNNLGIKKKVDGQVKALREMGYQVSIVKINESQLQIDDISILSIKSKIDYFINLPITLTKYLRRSDLLFELVYFRKTVFTPFYWPLFRRLRKHTRNLVMEIPTFPFKKELKNKRSLLLLDDVTNLITRQYIDKIVTSQHFDQIYGLPTVKIKNGYDFSTAPSFPDKIPLGKIIFISVASLRFWHGLDRLIYSMARYQKQFPGRKPVEFHIVGTGDEMQNLLTTVQISGAKGVYFHGAQYGVELSKLYKQSNIAVSSLGLYRKSATFHSSLKNMEYCYHGLPFVIGYKDPDLQNIDFVFEIPNDDTPIDMAAIVDWYEKLSTTPLDLHEWGKKMYSWNQQMSNVINQLDMN